MSYLLVKASQLKSDSFTYGDWRQYIAFLDDEERSAYCVRASTLPIALFFLGSIGPFALLLALGFAYQGIEIAWTRVLWLAAVGFAMMAPSIVFYLSQWRLVVTVSERMLPKEDGTWERSF